MKIKAERSFAGMITMKKGEERELDGSPALAELLRCGYVTRAGDEDGEGQRNNSRRHKKCDTDR